jgi:hypothetical protein
MSTHRHPGTVARSAAFIAAGGFFIIGIIFIPAPFAQAAGGATVSVTPASGSYAKGQTFTVSVMVDSGGGVGVNAADGELSFDPTMLCAERFKGQFGFQSLDEQSVVLEHGGNRRLQRREQ